MARSVINGLPVYDSLPKSGRCIFIDEPKLLTGRTVAERFVGGGCGGVEGDVPSHTGYPI